MNLTNEQLKKVREAKSMEEIIEFAKSEGIEMTEEEIRNQLTRNEGEISDNELSDVVGGGCGHSGPTRVNVQNYKCPSCGGQLVSVRFAYCSYDDGYGYFDLYDCTKCNRRYRQHENGIWTKNDD